MSQKTVTLFLLKFNFGNYKVTLKVAQDNCDFTEHITFLPSGIGRRMGGGKGQIDHYVTPVKSERIIMELAGHLEFEEVK